MTTSMWQLEVTLAKRDEAIKTIVAAWGDMGVEQMTFLMVSYMGVVAMECVKRRCIADLQNYAEAVITETSDAEDYDEMFTIAVDALLKKGVPHTVAQPIAVKAAQKYAQP